MSSVTTTCPDESDTNEIFNFENISMTELPYLDSGIFRFIVKEYLFKKGLEKITIPGAINARELNPKSELDCCYINLAGEITVQKITDFLEHHVQTKYKVTEKFVFELYQNSIDITKNSVVVFTSVVKYNAKHLSKAAERLTEQMEFLKNFGLNYTHIHIIVCCYKKQVFQDSLPVIHHSQSVQVNWAGILQIPAHKIYCSIVNENSVEHEVLLCKYLALCEELNKTKKQLNDILDQGLLTYAMKKIKQDDG